MMDAAALLLIGCLFTVSLVIAALAAWCFTRSGSSPGGDESFRALARSMRLSSSDRRLVLALAATHGEAKPAALLLSEHAFVTAANRFAALDRTRQGNAARHHECKALRRTIFGGAEAAYSRGGGAPSRAMGSSPRSRLATSTTMR